MKLRIKESQLRKLVAESVEKIMKENDDESYLDFNNNIYDDPSVARAYAQYGDKAVEHIRPTHRQSMKSDMGNTINVKDDANISKIVAEAINKVIAGK